MGAGPNPIGKINVCCLFAVSLPMGRGVKMAPKSPNIAPRKAREGPNTVSRAPKGAPRLGPKTP
eukprot:2952321-Pyramimonas_sp.AAC.1